MTEYKQVDLYGGAMTVQLPSNFADASEIRQIPDNQEVYLATNGLTSIVFEILERVEGKPTDNDALDYHFKDIIDDEGDAAATKVWTRSTAHFPCLPSGTVALTLLATSPAGHNDRGRANEADFVGILLTLIRLETQKTDLLISINVPHAAGEYVREDVDVERGKLGPLMEWATKEVRAKMLETFEVKDWGLFSAEEE